MNSLSGVEVMLEGEHVGYRDGVRGVHSADDCRGEFFLQ